MRLTATFLVFATFEFLEMCRVIVANVLPYPQLKKECIFEKFINIIAYLSQQISCCNLFAFMVVMVKIRGPL